MDEEEFARIDQMVFEHLHRGSLGPVFVALKDGSTIAGQIVSIARSGAIGRNDGSPAGELRLVAGARHVTVRYDEVEGIG
jgi:hypothetical protein